MSDSQSNGSTEKTPETFTLNKSRAKTTRKKVTLYVVIAICTVLFAGFLGVYTAINFGKLSVLDMLITLMPQSGLDSSINILVMGIDATEDSHRTDTLMLVHVDTSKNRVGVVSIPRDTRVEVPGHGITKINHAYAFGGVDLTVKAVTEFLQVPINYYVEINLQGVINVIDQLGGVTIDVDKRMYYVDRAGDLFIDLKPGKQILSGKQAMGYVRFRHDPAGDIGRIKRQQNFMKAVADKIIQSGNFFKAPQMFAQVTNNFKTNLTTKQLLLFGLKMRMAYIDNKIIIDTIPGSAIMMGGVSYWRPDLPETIKVVDKVIHGIEHVEAESAAATDDAASSSAVATVSKEAEISEAVSHVKKTEKSEESTSRESKNNLGESSKLTARDLNRILPTLKPVSKGEVLPDNMNLSVEILNGAGYPYIAKKIAKNLKSKGVKVPWVGNAAHFNYDKTVLVDWKGLTKEVLQLANSLKIDPKNIVSYNKPNKKLDVTLVIGKDWDSVKDRLQ